MKVDPFAEVGEVPVKVLNMYLTRSGRGGYIIRIEVVPMEGKLTRLEKRYPTKRFGEMRDVIKTLIGKIVEKGVPRSAIKFQSALMNFNSLV